MRVEQAEASITLNDIPEEVYLTEQTLWPNDPGIVFEPEARALLLELHQKLDPLLKKGQTIKTLAKELGVERIVKARLTPPREGLTWYGSRLIEVADWKPPDAQIETIAHELSHFALGPRPENKGHMMSGENRTPEIDKLHRILERVCNWGAGFILSQIKASGFQSF